MSGGYEPPVFEPPVEKPADDGSGSMNTDTTLTNKDALPKTNIEVDSTAYYKKLYEDSLKKNKELTEKTEKKDVKPPVEPKPKDKGDEAEKDYNKKVKETQVEKEIQKQKSRYDVIDDLLKENSYKGTKASNVFNKLAQQSKKETDVNDRVDVTYKSPIWKHEAGTKRYDDVIKSMKLNPDMYRYVTADTTRWNAPQAEVPGSGMDMIHWAVPKDEQLDPVLQTEIQSKTDAKPKNLGFLGNYYTYNKDNAKRDIKHDKKEETK